MSSTRASQGHAFVMGDAFTLADILPATAIFFATIGGVDVSPYRHIGAWMGRISGREALKRAQGIMG